MGLSFIGKYCNPHTQFIDFLPGCELQLMLWSGKIATKYVFFSVLMSSIKFLYSSRFLHKFVNLYLKCVLDINPSEGEILLTGELFWNLRWRGNCGKVLHKNKIPEVEEFWNMNSKTRKFSCGYDKKGFSSLHWVQLPVFTRKDYIGISRHKTIENKEFSSGSQHSYKYSSNNSLSYFQTLL